jgi:Na+-driven multidrug efflux pump
VSHDPTQNQPREAPAQPEAGPGSGAAPGAVADERVDASGAKPPVRVDLEEGRIRSGRLAGLSMWQAIWVLSWPVLTESMLNALVGLVDTTLAGSISEAATDAVGAASYFLWLFGLIGMAIGVGVTALISRAMGRGRVAAANAALGQSVLLSIVFGAFVAVGVWFAAPGIATLLSLSAEARPLAIEYLRILAWGVMPQAFLFSSIAACRGSGDSLSPLRIMIVVNAVNIGVSWLLSGANVAITRLDETGRTVSREIIPGSPIAQLGVVDQPLGLSGVAWGSVFAWLTGALLMAIVLTRGTHGLRLIGRRLKPHALTAKRLIRIGAPNFVETLGMWFGNFLVIFLVGQMARDGLLGSHIVAIRIEAFSFLPGFAMSMAAATLAGQYLGAGSPRLARLAVMRCTAIAVSIMVLFGTAFAIFPETIVGVFTQQQTHLEVTPTLLFICAFIQIPFGLAMCLRGAMRGAGDTTVVAAITWTSTYVVRVPLAWLCSGVEVFGIPNPAPLQEHFGLGSLEGLWIGLCTEHFIRAIFFTARFVHGGWTRVKV